MCGSIIGFQLIFFFGLALIAVIWVGEDVSYVSLTFELACQKEKIKAK